MVALQGEFGVNHYANELARGPSEGEEEKEGLGLGSVACLRVTSAQFLCSGNYGNRSSTNWRAFFLHCNCCRDLSILKWQAYGCCMALEFKSSVLGMY